jgi:hypothetical protein
MEVRTLSEQLLFTTVRIEARTSTGEISTGTSFIFAYEHTDDKRFSFLATNRHVVADATEVRFFFTQKGDDDKPLVGQRQDIHITEFERMWHGHPDPNIDVAVIPLSYILNSINEQGYEVFYKSIPATSIPEPHQMENIDAIEDIMFVGYPNGIFDATNLIPITRRGITATPVHIDYEAEPKFLIDASVFPGSSGSPVFTSSAGVYFDRGTSDFRPADTRFFLLGLISAVAVREERGRIDFVPIPTQREPIIRMNQMLNLGIVYKSSTVLETAIDLLSKEGKLS